MRILSQNKKISSTYVHVGIKEKETPVKTKNLKKVEKEYIISNQVEGMYGLPLGTYKTEERALEIIKDITFCTRDVFEMPKE